MAIEINNEVVHTAPVPSATVILLRDATEGLQVLLMPEHSSPTLTFMVTYRVGSKNEVTGTTGATHLLEHLMFKGSKNHTREKGNNVDQLLERTGALFNATTWLDRTNYYANMGSEHLATVVGMEADRMRNLLLREEDRKPEMTVVRDETFGPVSPVIRFKTEAEVIELANATEFGLFIGLDGDVDGMVHMSDIAWGVSGEEALNLHHKGEMVKAIVLDIDVEKERISLGIKQLEGDPYTNFIATHEKNSVVRATVKTVDARGAVMTLDGENEGYLRASEFSRDRIDDLSQHLKVGDTVEAMIINVDRKTRGINLSIKAKDNAEQHEAMQKLSAESSAAASGTTNLGALLKAKLNQQG